MLTVHDAGCAWHHSSQLILGYYCKSIIMHSPPFCEGAGHRKAVSYVRYLNGRELVSASTDSTLRLWDTKACTASRVFNGHNNEKNFVGLSVDNDFIACGSETNEVGCCLMVVCSVTDTVMTH